MTTRIALALKLPAEALPEYARRHRDMSDDMRTSITAHGGRNFSIFAAPTLGVVIVYVEVDRMDLWSRGADTEITKAWWSYMAQIMPTNEDLSPVSTDLDLVFHLD
ncbi:L-rhamnose mutarotase [Cryobacterium sp. TmT2-59]|uniref:L-rhamnose mutarotase n=1 Tax=Cryobacterium sp. TmT2-59 TaxID=1259264 RepID=UPI00106CDFFF|nr:L-rhamnose mutarotase [Cryobacterium sp. TmT2-59]TFC82120.1 L-rhamnose mutarotase [Cryobacterium sp. TmT2-59]